MLNSTEKILYLILFVIFFVVRKYYTGKYRDTKVKTSKLNIPDIVLLTLTGIAMIVPVIYVFSDVFDFADYSRPFWVGVLGVITRRF